MSIQYINEEYETDFSQNKSARAIIDAAIPNNTIITDIKLQKFQKEAEKLEISPMNPDQNVEGNYEVYLDYTLSDLAKMKNLRFEHAIEDKNIYENFPKDEIERLSKSKKILLLDLDETLIHADFAKEYENDTKNPYDTIISFESENEINNVGIFLRPGVKLFLENLSKFFEIGIFTASVSEYADEVIKFLDPENNFIKFKLYRQNCVNVNDILKVKDLRILKNFDLKNVVLVDNNMYSFAAQLSNGILINSFYCNKNDNELYNVYGYLMNYIYQAEDVRKVNEEFFGFKKLRDEIYKKKKFCYLSDMSL